MIRTLVRALSCGVLCLLLAASPALAQSGLVRVDSDRFQSAQIAPGVAFSDYTRVMIDPAEASFKRSWRADFNSLTTSDRISEDEARQILTTAQSTFHDALVQAYTAAGYQVVTTPAPDVVRIRASLTDIEIQPVDPANVEQRRAHRAGQATLTLEARDSMSGALIARAEDERFVGASSYFRRPTATYRADFADTFRAWAQKSAEAFGALRGMRAPAAAGGSHN
jgi:hypothetical protein